MYIGNFIVSVCSMFDHIDYKNTSLFKNKQIRIE